MVIATLMIVLIHGRVIDSLIDVVPGRSNFKKAVPEIKRNRCVNGGRKGASTGSLSPLWVLRSKLFRLRL